MASTIHANARTTPRIRREIQMAPSSVSNAALARRYGIHRHTVANKRVFDLVVGVWYHVIIYQEAGNDCSWHVS